MCEIQLVLDALKMQWKTSIPFLWVTRTSISMEFFCCLYGKMVIAHLIFNSIVIKSDFIFIIKQRCPCFFKKKSYFKRFSSLKKVNKSD
jgi:hypothetical protein